MSRGLKAPTSSLAPLDLATGPLTRRVKQDTLLLPYTRPAVAVSPGFRPRSGTQQATYSAQKDKAITLEQSATYIVTQKGQRVVLGEPFIASSEGTISMARILGTDIDQIVVAKEMKIPTKFVGACVMSGHERVVANAVNLAHMAQSPYAPLGVLAFDDTIVELLPVAAGHLGHALFSDVVGGRIDSRILLAKQTMQQIGRQLERVHQAGISHRDVALKNILFSFTGELGLADFGLAAPSHTLFDASCSLEYAAPEVVSRVYGTDHGPYHGPSADMWSLGVTLATIIVGRMPFSASHARATQQQRFGAVNSQQRAWYQAMVSLHPWLVAGAVGTRPTIASRQHEAFVGDLLSADRSLATAVLALLNPDPTYRPSATSLLIPVAKAEVEQRPWYRQDGLKFGLHPRLEAKQMLKSFAFFRTRLWSEKFSKSLISVDGQADNLDKEKQALAGLLFKVRTDMATQVATARMFGALLDGTGPDPSLKSFISPPATKRRHSTGEMIQRFDPDHELRWQAIRQEVSFCESSLRKLEDKST